MILTDKLNFSFNFLYCDGFYTAIVYKRCLLIENFLKLENFANFTVISSLWIVFRIGGLFVLEDTPLEDF